MVSESIVGVNGKVVYCELRFQPDVALVSVVREFVTVFYRRVLMDADVTDRLALTTHELLENAVKYAVSGETAVRIEVDQQTTPWEVSIRTWNRTSPEHRATVEESFRQSKLAPDAFSFYQQVIAKAAKRTEGSGLGLARIQAEADMSLAYELEDEQICIIARLSSMPEKAA